MSEEETKSRKRFPASVVEVISRQRVVINRGSTDGVRVGEKFLIYELSPKEIIDPSTKESLGRIEYVKGTGIAIHVQSNLTTIEAETKIVNERVIKKRKPNINNTFTLSTLLAANPSEEEETITQRTVHTEFEYVKDGDLAKKI